MTVFSQGGEIALMDAKDLDPNITACGALAWYPVPLMARSVYVNQL